MRRPSDPTRRTFLRASGVALALPWLESLSTRSAHGASGLGRKRFVSMNFPNGVSDFWKPQGTGAGDAWQLSPILEPLAPLKNQVTVLSDVGNYSPWNGHVEPSHANLYGGFLTCIKASGPMDANRGISVDQVIANGIGAATPLPSLQVGLSTLDSYTDGLPAAHSRSVSWAAPDKPLYKLVDPQQVFDKLFNVATPPRPDTSAADKSILDQVLGQAQALQPALSKSDRARVDEFLTSVRAVEQNIAAMAMAPTCMSGARPAESYSVAMVPPDYNRDTHANIMIDLVTLALQCDLTRVVTFMLDDARSDFVYSFLTARDFTATGSTPSASPMPLGGLHGLSASGDSNSPWATINYWFVQKLVRLCQKLQAIQDGTGGSVLDQSVVWFGTEMHGGNHDGLDLPVLYVGSGGGRLVTGQHIDFLSKPLGEDLASVYFTFINKVFDLGAESFGVGLGDYAEAGQVIVPEIVAT
ncbi:MAG TPA: DUF1552 domain-containing protein [Polyangia bacterium]|nr:DUF1552 domain-containing protein [Polyangia bacterium]